MLFCCAGDYILEGLSLIIISIKRVYFQKDFKEII